MTEENLFKPDLDPEDYYKDEQGFIVFTEKHHLKRGFCCQNGCRHCPYVFNPKTGKFNEEKRKSTMDKFKNLLERK